MKVFLMMIGSLLLVTGILASLGNGGNSEAVDLSSYRWRHRLLLIFSPSTDFAAYQTLLQQLHQERTGVLDRDLIVFRLVNQGHSQVGKARLNHQEVETLRRRFGVTENEFRVVLIGKDGGVKLSERSVDLVDVFGLIDSMPMRQREMEEKRR